MKKNILLLLSSLFFTFSYSQVSIGGSTYVSSPIYDDVATDGYAGSTGSYYTNVGNYSGASNYSSYNAFLGYRAGYWGNNGDYGVAIGYYAIGSGYTSADDFVAVGASALRALSTGSFNVGIGSMSGRYTDTGEKNSYLGGYSGFYNSSGDFNVGIGYAALYTATGANGNTAVGYNSLAYVTTSSNTAVGYAALEQATSAIYNTSIGSHAGDLITTGDLNTILGAEADPSANSAQNQTAIGYQATGQADNSVTLGNSDVTAIYMAEDSGATVYAGGLNIGGAYSLPSSDGSADQVLSTNGSGSLSWTNSGVSSLTDLSVTSSATELNYVDGVTSNVQTQLDSKQATITGAGTTITSSDLTASRAVISNGSGKVEVSAVTSTELGYLDGVTSAVQTQLDSKQATIIGAATTIDDTDLTASRALVSNGSGKVEVSAVTSTELGYLDGVSSAVQTQLDSKLSSSGNVTFGGNLVIPDAGTVGSTSDTDAMTIAANGNTTFSQDVTVSGDVTISSDARLKSNIVSLGSTLSKLLLIDGKSYTMNKSGEEKIGILAQEVQEVFPELVSEDNNEMLSVNYQGLVPVLINAIKEQEDKISRLENLVEKLISEK